MIAASVKFSFKLNIGCPKNYKPKKFILDWLNQNKLKDEKVEIKNVTLDKGVIGIIGPNYKKSTSKNY